MKQVEQRIPGLKYASTHPQYCHLGSAFQAGSLYIKMCSTYFEASSGGESIHRSYISGDTQQKAGECIKSLGVGQRMDALCINFFGGHISSKIEDPKIRPGHGASFDQSDGSFLVELYRQE
jgi:hypothetical protein